MCRKCITETYLENAGLFVFNESNLIPLLQKHSAIIISNVDKNLNRTTQIKYICNCGIISEKRYDSIQMNGAYCHSCLHRVDVWPLDPTIYISDNPVNIKCVMCCQIKLIEEYGKTNIEYYRVCNECIKNPISTRERLYNHNITIKKQKGPCVDCGETNINLLQFDHINRNEKIDLVRNCVTISSMNDEASKCEMRCCICHCRRTKIQMNWKKEPNEFQDHIDSIKQKIGGCQLCGWYDETLLEALHFDHLDQSTKLANISDLANDNPGGLSIQYNLKLKINTEISKCRLLCANCHCLHTREQLGFKDRSDNILVE